MLKNILIKEHETVQQALKKLSLSGKKALLVVDSENHLLGTLSDGDIRLFILSGQSIKQKITEIFNRKPISVANDNFRIEDIKHLFLEHLIELIPIVDAENHLIDYITWSKAFSEDSHPFHHTPQRRLKVPVIIMAGGKGTRLEPFTKIFPKPLIPIGEKPVVELIIDEFRKFKVNDFYMTLNYKGDMIVSYFNSIKKEYNLKFVWEKQFLGTAGSIKLLSDELSGDFIVSNCDIIVRAGFDDVVKFHKENHAALTVISSMQSYKIPYGVVHFKKGGKVQGIKEKPEYTFTINTGVYVLNRKVLKYIPADITFDMPSLIDVLIKNDEKVLMYPIHEGSYVDIGQWDEFKRATKKLTLERENLEER
ncbi:MAG: NTP transferase domain-containing protein [Candidatus Riflebacteria bacterium]|nr:NTP transferase domain-containing protein [Candidatus Riflebacteria bacterium]